MNRRIVNVQPYGADSYKTVTHLGVNYSVSAVANQTLIYQFPHGVIDLSKLLFTFRFARLGNSNDLIPRDCETLIDELEVMLGDTVVNKISNYQQMLFILSTYGKGADWQMQGVHNPRLWTNRRMIATSTNMDNWFMGMDEFLGFLGCKQIIDTRKLGKLTVRMRLADNATVTQNPTSATWGMRDPVFRAHYMPDAHPSVQRVSFDDFTSVRHAFPGYMTKTTLIVDGRKRLDYAVARILTASMHDTKVTSIEGSINIPNRFRSEAGRLNTWEITLNGKPYHAFNADAAEGWVSMQDVYPDGVFNAVTSGNPQPYNLYDRAWACGALLDLPQREDGQQWEIGFETTPRASGVDAPAYTFLFAKSTSVVDASSGKLELIL